MSVVVQFESSVTVSLSGAGIEKAKSWQLFVCWFVFQWIIGGKIVQGN